MQKVAQHVILECRPLVDAGGIHEPLTLRGDDEWQVEFARCEMSVEPVRAHALNMYQTNGVSPEDRRRLPPDRAARCGVRDSCRIRAFRCTKRHPIDGGIVYKLVSRQVTRPAVGQNDGRDATRTVLPYELSDELLDSADVRVVRGSKYCDRHGVWQRGSNTTVSRPRLS